MLRACHLPKLDFRVFTLTPNISGLINMSDKPGQLTLTPNIMTPNITLTPNITNE